MLRAGEEAGPEEMENEGRFGEFDREEGEEEEGVELAPHYDT